MKKIEKLILIPKLFISLLLSILVKNNKWLICEKTDEARDNGYHFFKYCMENIKDNSKDNIYYVIDKKSFDIKKIIKYKSNIIYTNSFRHCMYYFKSKKLISSQALPFPVSEKICRKIFPVKNQKFYWLQHGVTLNYLRPEDMDWKHKQYSLVCCASPFESKFFIDKYGYNENQAVCTGFCRFDNLLDLSNNYNYVLIMPTYRKWLASSNQKNKPEKYEEEKFIKSDFYNNYHNLLKNKTLLNFINEKNLKVIFYLHYGLQNYSYLFDDCSNEKIIIAKRNDFDVQDLMLKSKIMITDYSSVFFDFSYMKKPIIYYQFDYEKFRGEHYKEGYFSYKKNGFGPILENSEEVASYLRKIYNDKKDIFQMEKEYLNKLDVFFPNIDYYNCKRIYSLIENDK